MNQINRKALYLYLAIAFSLAWILFILPRLLAGSSNPASSGIHTLFWSLAMWAPGVAAILSNRYVLQQPIEMLGLRRLGPRHMLFYAWLIPPLLAIMTGIITWALGLGIFDSQLSQIQAALQNAPGGVSTSPWLVVGVQILFAITLAPLINTIFALGEELGWRGFLLPQLLPLGQGKAILISGIIWGIWHAPAILQGLNYPAQPYLGILFMVVFCVLLGTFLSWLYLRTKSPWVPALAHGSINATAGIALLFLKGVNITYSGTVASPVGWISLGLLVIWLYRSKRLPVHENQKPPENVSRETI